jgi:hypothetical protein
VRRRATRVFWKEGIFKMFVVVGRREDLRMSWGGRREAVVLA